MIDLSKLTLDVIPLEFSFCRDRGINLSLIQTSYLHPLASGNKLFKLAVNIDVVRQSAQYSKIISFGGPYSNHLYALAQLTQAYDIGCTAIVRGYPQYISNPTLSVLDNLGVDIIWADKKTYRRRYDDDYLLELQQKNPDAFIIPEGGTNANALVGCQQLGAKISALDLDINTVVLPCGTGGTLAGLATGLVQGMQLIAYDVVGDPQTGKRVAKLIADSGKNAIAYQIKLLRNIRYGRLNEPLVEFICDFVDQTNILLDPLYTSVTCQKLFEDIQSDCFPSNTNIAIVHTGGLQAWHGMQTQFIKYTNEEMWQQYVYSNLSW